MQFYSDELAMAVRARRKQPTTETSTSVAARNRVSRSTIRPRYYKNNNDSNNNNNNNNSSNMSNRLFNPYSRSNNSHRPQETASRITARPQSRLTVRSAYRPRPSQQSAVSMPRSRVSVRSSVRARHQEPDNGSYLSESIYTSLSRASSRDTWEQGNWEEEDVPPAVLYNTTYSTASVDTYDSTLSDEDETHVNYGLESDGNSSTSSYSAGIPPAVLPPYQCVPMSETATVRASDPESFAHLFPSMARLSIRHDERTADGNMNLRVDTIVPDPGSRRRRPVAVQLFHLRMHDLARRDFSLRRYCRDSGREVCNSKGATPRNPNDPRPGFQQSVTSAIRSMKTSFRRSHNAGGPSSVTGSPDPRRPSFASNTSWNCGVGGQSSSVEEEDGHDGSKPPAQRPIPANTIKLEFSNYARVEIVRHRHKAYEFEWWGHKYAWRRVVDKGLGKIAYHLIRGGQGPPVAIIVPEGRSPTQVEADNHAGSWIPPCHMWISDRSVIEVMTDVADVVVATGLMALVDDCIRQRWPAKKPRAAVITAATPSRSQQQQQQPQIQQQQQPQQQQQQQQPQKQLKNLKRKQTTHANNTDLVRRRTFMHGLFQRQRQHHAAYSPLRIRNVVRPVTAY